MDAAFLGRMKKIRFLAANFSRLQGLRAIPIGLLLFCVSYWANRQTGPATDLWIPLLLGLLGLILAVVIEQYYRRTFGRMIAPESARKNELILSTAAAVTALAAFLIETRFDLPFSPVGLVFAIIFAIETLRMSRYLHNWYTSLMLIQAMLTGFVSVLPALGLDRLWSGLGIKADLLGICMAVGLTLVINGFISHWFFVKNLPKEA